MDVALDPQNVRNYLDQQMRENNKNIQFLDHLNYHRLADPGSAYKFKSNADVDTVVQLQVVIEKRIADGKIEVVDGKIKGSDTESNFSNPFFLDYPDDRINWLHLTLGLRYYDSTQISATIDYASAIYNRYSEYIQSNFTGAEQDSRMATLHEFFARGIEEIANSYASDVGDFLERYGVVGEKNLLKESILALLDDNLSAKTGVSLADLGITILENKTGNLYSRDDILALGFMQIATARANEQPEPWVRDDLPAAFLNYAMKKTSIYEAFSVSDSLKDKFESVFYNRINKVIEMHNETFAEALKIISAYHAPDEWGRAYYEESKVKYTPFDKEYILQVVNSFLENMHSGLSAVNALEKTDYFDTFFKTNPCNNNVYYTWLGGHTMIDRFDKFLTQMGLIRQISENGISWTV